MNSAAEPGHLYGLLGDPVSHSISPAMMQAAFAHDRRPGCYLPLQVPTDRLRDAIHGLAPLGYAGVNITIPHKEAAAYLCDELTPVAEAVGAVNTIALRGDRLVGSNTDAQGFASWMSEEALPAAWRASTLAGKQVVLLGAGGAARAVFYACASLEAAAITLCNRTLSRAEAVRQQFQGRFQQVATAVADAADGDAAAQALAAADLVVNCTPVGMWPDKDDIPVQLPASMRPHALVVDLVYNPAVSRLVQAARERGLRAENGLGMLVAQGAWSYATWTTPPQDEAATAGAARRIVPVMRKAAESALKTRKGVS